jgi:hypothetical protein
MKGGKAIASGSVGCLFRPPLKCKGDTERPENYVSKLMTSRNADYEYEEIERILRYVRRVKNAGDYFVLKDIKLCVPDDKLTKGDIEGFDSTCSFFNDNENIFQRNLERPIKQGKLKMLQLPDGGATLYNMFSDGIMSNEGFPEVNRALIRLLVGGLIPLNKSQVIHADVKDTNIVYSLDTKKARLIDWGLSFHYDSPNRAPIQDLEHYSIMVNQPVNRLMFYSRFVSKLNDFSKEHKVTSIKRKTIANLMPIYVDYLKSHFFSEDKQHMKRTFDRFFDGTGHLSYVKSTIRLLNNYMFSKYKTSIQDVLANNIANAYLTFSLVGGELKDFDENSFFKDVYRHNCDVFGFLYSYHNLLYRHPNFSMPYRFKVRLGEILMKYLYSAEFAGKRYNIKEIVRELRGLDKLALDNESTFSPEHYPTPSPASLRSLTPVKVKSKTPTPSSKTRKRCPKGFRRDRKTRECVKVPSAKPKSAKVSSAKVVSPDEIMLAATRKRCPRRYHIVKGTRKCRKVKG